MAHVLYTGVDRTLMQTRTMLLQRAGHAVVSATGEPELIDVCSQNDFDVAVISQVVSPPEKKRILRLVRQYCPRTKVLELFSPASGKSLPEADDWLETPVSPPEDLAERVATLASKSSGTSSR